MIDKIYEDIREKLLGLSLIEAKEYFDFDNIPESLTDKTFNISPMPLLPGDFLPPSTRLPQLINLKAEFKINLSMDLPADNIINTVKITGTLIEDIIKTILNISVGGNEKDQITFVGSDFQIKQNSLIYDINFDLNYRITNL